MLHMKSVCEYCGEPFNGAACGWLCPHCGWKNHCCGG